MACIAKRRGVWVVDWRDALGKRHRDAVEGTRDDAKKRLAEVLKGEGQTVETKKTFREYAEEWLKTYGKTELKESTYREYEAAFKNHLYPVFGPLPFTKVTKGAVRKLVAGKLEDGRVHKLKGEEQGKGLSRSTVRNIIAPLRELYNHAIDDGAVSFNPASRVGRFNKRRSTDKKIDPLTREELSTLLDKANEKMPHHYPLLLCAARTGIREGELIGLKWCNIDFHGRFLEVKHNVVRGKVTSPKNGKTRKVDMSLQLTNVLDRLLGQRKAESLKREMERPPEERRKHEGVLAEVMESWIFTTPIGTQLDPNNLRKYVFYRCLDHAELRRVRFHDLRHTFASLLIQQGESLAYIRDQLGHSSIQITVDTYGHLVPGGNRQAVDRLDDMEQAVEIEQPVESGHKMVTDQLKRESDYV